MDSRGAVLSAWRREKSEGDAHRRADSRVTGTPGHRVRPMNEIEREPSDLGAHVTTVLTEARSEQQER